MQPAKKQIGTTGYHDAVEVSDSCAADEALVENVEYDLFYIQNYSPLLDISILARTLWVVARGRGAY